MTRLPIGKLPIETLESTFLKSTGAASVDVVTQPLAGLDFGAVRVGGKYMVVSSDPVTGVVQDIGRYAMNVNANDVATSGNRPQFAESVVLLPEGADTRYARNMAKQMDSEARRLGVSVIGGHTEVTPGLRRPIVVATAFSFVDRFVSSRDAKAGDTIMITKTAGIEGTAVMTGSRGLLSQISVVDEAVAAFETGQVHAMHDCTEGGVLGAVFEMSLASGLGFELEAKRVPVAEETKKLCRRMSMDPLKLIGSGALLIAVANGSERKVTEAISSISRVTPVGRFTERGRILVAADGRRQRVNAAPEDELWRVFSKSSGRRHRL